MFFLFHGDDTHSQKQFLAKQQAKLGDPEMLSINTTELDGKTVTLADIQSASNAMPFLAPKRLVLVNGLFANKPPKELLNGLADWLPKMPETTNLIFLESKALAKSNKLIKLAAKDKKVGYVKLFERPQGRALNKWIEQAVTERGGTINPRAVNMLSVNVGNDLQALTNEIEKLVLYKNGERIEAQDVELLSPYSAESSIFNLVDAIGTRNGKVAASLLQQQLASGTDPFYLFSMIIRQFRLLLQVRECREANMPSQEIASAVGMHPFVAQKLSQQVRNFSLDQLENIYHHLLKIDIGVKTGQSDMVTSLNLLVVTLTK